jgi:hypothetical protein
MKDPDGRPIIEHTRLTGSKFAVRRGGNLCVSPAMMRLIEDCQSPDELCHLLEQIPYRVLSQSSPLPTPKTGA